MDANQWTHIYLGYILIYHEQWCFHSVMINKKSVCAIMNSALWVIACLVDGDKNQVWSNNLKMYSKYTHAM